MNLQEFRLQFTKTLSALYPKTEIETFFFLLIEHHLNMKRIDVTINPKTLIKTEKEKLLLLATNRLEKEEPIEYILGETEFYGFPFKVNTSTLIPRPETEELVEWIINSIKNSTLKNSKKPLEILDIGTGSGCIAISLAKQLENTNITAMDVSEEALKVAKKNAELNKVKVNFVQKNILKTKNLDKNYDIIVSNPPYVRNLEKQEIKNNVLKNEPHLALFVEDNNPLLFYEVICDSAKQNLSANGFLFFEINQYLGKETKSLVLTKGFKNTILKKDLFGNERMIKAQL